MKSSIVLLKRPCFATSTTLSLHRCVNTQCNSLSRPEDIEEISDEEAEWSDEGDPIYALDFDVNFGDDFDEPIFKDIDFLAELKPLSFFSVRKVLTGLDEDDDITAKLERIRDLDQKPVGTEWVEMVEQVSKEKTFPGLYQWFLQITLLASSPTCAWASIQHRISASSFGPQR